MPGTSASSEENGSYAGGPSTCRDRTRTARGTAPWVTWLPRVCFSRLYKSVTLTVPRVALEKSHITHATLRAATHWREGEYDEPTRCSRRGRGHAKKLSGRDLLPPHATPVRSEREPRARGNFPQSVCPARSFHALVAPSPPPSLAAPRPKGTLPLFRRRLDDCQPSCQDAGERAYLALNGAIFGPVADRDQRIIYPPATTDYPRLQ